jgi:Uma2 family endonuclease
MAPRDERVMELEGALDMVLEIVSNSSMRKDFEKLPDYYAEAGVGEFWRVDARKQVRFEILRLSDDGYVAAAESEGWFHSDVFGKSFRLVKSADSRGKPKFNLEVR